MKGFPVDLTGLRFTRLTVIRRVQSKTKNSRWMCQCDCGNIIESDRSPLTGGDSRSCGCLKREEAIARFTTHGNFSGGKQSVEYMTWARILNRCRNPNCPKFPRYGQRGISVCDRWLTFENFLSDMGQRPLGCTSIDRIDNNGNYEHGNCRWSTGFEQSRNRSDNIIIEYNGEALIASDWAKRLGIGLTGFLKRYREWPIEQVMTTPVRKQKSYQRTPAPGVKNG